MADATILVKSPTEGMKAFNKRLIAACVEAPVTHAKAKVVDGQPMVKLFSDISIATPEDVEDGLAEKVGEEFLEAGPIMCAVCRVKARTEGDSNKSEERLDSIFEIAGGLIDKDVSLSIEGVGIEMFQPDDDETAAPIPLQVQVHYELVVWDRDDEDDEGEEGSDDEPSDVDEQADAGEAISDDERGDTPGESDAEGEEDAGDAKEPDNEDTDEEVEDPV